MGTVASVVGAVVFFFGRSRVEFPVVDLRAFANRNFAFGSLFSFVMGIGLYGLTYLYPLYLGRIRGYDSLMIGETMFVSGLAMFLTAPVAGGCQPDRSAADDDDRLRQLRLGHLHHERMTADWDFYELLMPQILRGLRADDVHGADQQHGARNAAAVTHPGRFGPVQPDPEPRWRRRAGGHQHDVDQREQGHYARLSEHVHWGNPAAIERMEDMAKSFNAYGLDGATMAIRKMSGLVHQQAAILSFSDIFQLLTLLFATLVVCALLIKKAAGSRRRRRMGLSGPSCTPSQAPAYVQAPCLESLPLEQTERQTQFLIYVHQIFL